MAKKGILLLGILLVLAGIAASFLGKTWKAGDRWTAPAGANGFRSDEYLVWSNNDRLIAGLPGQIVTCYQLGSPQPVWTRSVEGSVQAVAASPDRVYVCISTMKEPGSDLLVLDAANGSTRRFATGDEIEKLCGYSFFLPGAMAWVPSPGVLALINSSDGEADNVCFVDGDLTKVISKATAPGYSKSVSSSPGALTICIMTNQAHVIDAITGRHLQHWGKGNSESPIDGTALSNAHGHADGTLALVHDHGGWSDGTVEITSPASPVTFSSENAHAITAVDWKHRVIAISGTSKNLILKTFDGEPVDTIRNACSERIYKVSFSPDGRHVAVLSQSGELKVFKRPG